MKIGKDFLCPFPCTCKNYQTGKPRCSKCEVIIKCTGYEPSKVKIRELKKQGIEPIIPER